MKHTKKKFIIVVACAATLNIFVTLAIVSLVVYINLQDEQPQTPQVTESVNNDTDVFYSYIEKSLKSNSTTQEASYAGNNTEFTARGTIDARVKKYSIAYSFTCSARYNGQLVGVKSSIQADNAATYVRLDDVEGTLGDPSSGTSLDLSTTFSRVTGVWYKAGDDEALQSQLNNGVYAFVTSIMAPEYDSSEILKTIEKNDLYDIKSSKKVGKNYEFNVRVQRDTYIRTLSEAFPKLGNVDAIAKSNFGETNQALTSKVTITEDGSLVSEEMTIPNQCTNILDTYLGAGYADVPATATGTSYEKPDASINIPPITNARPIANIQQDLSL